MLLLKIEKRLNGLIQGLAQKKGFPGNAFENTYCFIILLFDIEIVKKHTQKRMCQVILPHPCITKY